MYKGNKAEIPLGSMGLFTDVAPSAIPFTALIQAKNIDYGPGYIQKASGSLRYNNVAFSASVIALTDYRPQSHFQRMFAATADGNIYRDIGDKTFGGNTAILTGLGPLTNQCQFVIAGAETANRPKKVFFFSNGLNQIKVLSDDESVFEDITTPSADWVTPNFPKFGLTHRNQLWTFLRDIAYASTTGDHESFTGSGNISMTVGPGDGGECVAAIVYKGKMLVFKEGDVVYALNDDSTDAADWYFYKFGAGFGVSSVHASLQALDDLIVGSSTGSLTSYAAVQNFGDLKSGDILSQASVADYYRANTSPSGIAYMHALYYQDKKLALFTARTKYRQENDALIQLDASKSGVPRYGLWTKDIPECLALRRDINGIKRPMYGSSDGYIYLMDQEDRLVGGSAFTGEFKTPHLDFSHLDPKMKTVNKLYDFLGVNFVPEGNHNMSVDVFIDGKFTETITFIQRIDTNYLGAFTLGTSKLGTEEEQTIWKPLHGTGRKISFRCYNSGASENFKVTTLTVGFRVAGEQATRLQGG